MPDPKMLYVGRDARGRIMVDSVSMSDPAVTIRHTLTPFAAMRLADELSEHANDHQRNAQAYPFDTTLDWQNDAIMEQPV
jgi:hypothetical protein